MHRLIVVGDYPSAIDAEQETVMASSKDALTFTILSDVIKAPLEEITRLYAVPIRPESGEKPDKAAIKEFQEDLLARIDESTADTVLCVGEMPMYAITGEEGIVKNRGKVIKVTLTSGKEIKVIPVFSPYYIEKNPHQLKSHATDINKAWMIGNGMSFEEELTKVVQVEHLQQVIDVFRYVKQTKICCFDWETTKLTDLHVFDPNFKATTLGISFQVGSAYSIPLFHKDSPFTEEETLSILHTFFEEILADPEIEKIAHNAKFERQVAQKYGATLFRGRWNDPMLMHHLLDEQSGHGLKDIVSTLFPQFEGWEDVIKQNGGWDKVPLNILCGYNGIDCDVTLRIATHLETELMKDDKVYRIYRSLQMYAFRALSDAEMTGMMISKETLLKNINRAQELADIQEAKLRDHKQVLRFQDCRAQEVADKKIAELEEKIKTAKGKNKENYEQQLKEVKLELLTFYDGINFGSTKQLADLLYSKEGFGYKKVWDRKKGKEAESTGKEFITELKDHTGFIEDLLLWRSIKKTLSTYLVGIYDRLDEDSRIHTSFLQHGTESGRLSSRNPNLQNLPNLSKLTNPLAIECTEMVKKAFVCPAGYRIVQVDYSQAELRIIASFAGEKAMLDAYNKGIDLHAKYAAKMLSVELEEFYKLDAKMQKQWRTRAKAGNFGLIYGMSAEGLVDYAWENYLVRITLKEATKMRDDFFEMYPKLLEYHATYIKKAQKFGFVRTLFGRKRHTPKIHEKNDFIRSMDERVAINSPVQGTAGEFTILALAILNDRLDPRVKIVNTVHDSIIFYIPEEILEPTLKLIKYTCENLPMEHFGKVLEGIGMAVDLETSTENWKAMEEYKLSA